MRYFTGDLNTKKELILDEPEIKHCLKVLRYKEGDTIQVINGRGDIWVASLTGKTGQSGILQILKHSQIDKISHSNLHLAIAPTKNADRIEWLIEKATELGVKHFSILFTHRTERKKVNTTRLNTIAINAIKQSRQTTFPEIEEMDFKTLISTSKSEAKYIASCENTFNKTSLGIIDTQIPTLILIGPEGDFTEEELNFAITKGFKVLSLGENRLRTETAGLMVAAAFYTV